MLGFYTQIKRLREELFVRTDYLLLEAANVFMLLVWTIAILPPQSDLFVGGRAYDLVSRVLTENQFGVLFLFIFLNSFFALLHGSLRYRAVFATLQTILYFTLLGFFVNSNPHSAVALLVGGMAVFSAIVASRIIRDIRDHVPSWTL